MHTTKITQASRHQKNSFIQQINFYIKIYNAAFSNSRLEKTSKIQTLETENY
jgi:hypothetical protein